MAVSFSEKGFLDLARGVPGDKLKNNLPGTLVPGEFFAKSHNLLFRTGYTLLKLNDRGGDLTQPLVRQTDHGHILDLLVSTQKILDLYRIEVFASGNDHVLFPVYQIDKPVLVHPGHISCVEPAVL